MSNETKQLKKSDFLNCVSEEPMTREQLVDSLADFEFIGSYLDYLTDHFEAQGKIVKNEDGTIQRKAKKGATNRDLFRVEENEDGDHIMVKRTLEKGEYFDADAKEAGWASTPGAAIKKACSQVFADYKEQVALIKELAE